MSATRFRPAVPVAATLAAGMLLIAASRSDRAAQVLSVTLGPEVLASVNEDGGHLRVEPSIVLAGETVVVAWNDSRLGRVHGSPVGVGIAWSVSADGGRFFRFGGYLPGTSGADSWLASTQRGEILLQMLSWSEVHTISVHALTPAQDRGWTPRGTAVVGARVDKPAMATSADDWVGIAYSAGSEIHAVRSTDGGATWSLPVRVSAADSRLRTGAAIASCGGYTVVAWAEGSGLTLNEFRAAWSADGGRTYSEAERVRTLSSHVKPPPGYALGVGPAAYISNNAWLACSGAGQPTFHLTYGEGREAGSAVIYQTARIVEGQLRWSEPELIAGSDSVWALWPAVAVFGDEVGILYYDSRHSANGRPLMDAYLSVGTPGSFTDYRLSSVSTSWPDVPGDREYAPVQRNFGDYISLASDGRRGIAAWTDGRTGAPRIVVRSFEVDVGQ